MNRASGCKREMCVQASPSDVSYCRYIYIYIYTQYIYVMICRYRVGEVTIISVKA